MKKVFFELRATKVEGGYATLRLYYVDESGTPLPSRSFGESGKVFQIMEGDKLTIGPMNHVDMHDGGARPN